MAANASQALRSSDAHNPMRPSKVSGPRLGSGKARQYRINVRKLLVTGNTPQEMEKMKNYSGQKVMDRLENIDRLEENVHKI